MSEKKKLKVATTSLAGCFGCHMSFLDIDERLFTLLEHIEFDRSPLTEADLASHRLLVAGLEALTPDIPVLSEESAALDPALRRSWPRLWLVDPLDGTREFVKKNGEFCVCIALVEHGVL